MNNSELIAKVAEVTGYTQKEVKNILTSAGEVIFEQVKNKGKSVFPGLGKVSYKKSEARSCINPSTKEKMEIPARGKMVFTPGLSVKETLQDIV